ncbi:MAG: AAA family ATPase [Deltaproteobacteria bacterium]|nr:AAA family ATPase [Deltaproteobacteria bacterium]
MPKTNPIEINERFQQALELMENTDRHLFVTGKAGTGKSTLLDHFRKMTRKKIAVLAPTGVAALNVRGQTIHSFCGFKPDISLDKVKKKSPKDSKRPTLYKQLETIVIDEVSMVRADLLDCVEKFLRLNGRQPKKSFGGIQMIFIGDLYQLPPVVTSAEKAVFRLQYETPYFFSSRIFTTPRFEMEFVELEKIYRQTDEDFIGLLNAIRNRSITDADMVRLNQNCAPDFLPEADDFYIYLTSTNDQAFQRNQEKLDRLAGKAVTFQGLIEGDFEPSALPTETILEVKTGAQVMLLNNDPLGRWVNGSIGKITGIISRRGEEDTIQVELEDNTVARVTPVTWEILKYTYDANARKIFSQPVGAFTQYPLKLAWAITIHKSQGKTFEKVVIDIGRGTFAHGQVYVALSRCTSLKGLILSKPIQKHHILMDFRVVKFLTRFQYKKAEERLSYVDKVRIIKEVMEEKKDLEIIYLKPDDTKSRRRIRPESIEMMEYGGKRFEGLRAYCHERQDLRHFRLDRILEIKTETKNI